MAYTKQDTEDLEAEVARIRAKRNKGINKEALRKFLNMAFMVGAVIGVAFYFWNCREAGTHEGRVTGMWIVGGSMILKVAEFIVRLTL